MENIYLQEKLTSLGLRLEDLKKQKASAGQKTIEKSAKKVKRKKGKKEENKQHKEELNKQKEEFNAELLKQNKEVKRL